MIENEIKSRGDLLIEEAEKRGISIGEKRGISIGEKRGISIGEKRGKEISLKNNIENLAKRLRIQSKDQLTMEEALKQAKEWLTEPV